jgi:alpha-1,2-mannosyltransferase
MFSNVTMTNSSWTQNHISNLLQLGRRSYLSSLLNFDRRPSSPTTDSSTVLDDRGAFVHDPPRIVYPPCDTDEFLRLGNLDARKPVMVSLAQFRPEKDHAKQIEALGLLFERHPGWKERGVKLLLMGSCRNEDDEKRIRGLEELADKLGVRVSCVQGSAWSGTDAFLYVQEYTEFVVNAPFSEIVQRLGEASIGLNTMVDEHFGISVVEFMVSRLLVCKLDIADSLIGGRPHTACTRLGRPIAGYHHANCIRRENRLPRHRRILICGPDARDFEPSAKGAGGDTEGGEGKGAGGVCEGRV